MKRQDEFWARLDGEMRPDEAGRFDRSLTPEESGRMGGELMLERSLAERLARQAPGADEAWQAALARVKGHEQALRLRTRRRRLAWAAVPVAMAAMALVMLSSGYFQTGTPEPWYLSVGTQDGAAQVSPSQVRAAAAEARNLLRDRAMHMSFDRKNSLESDDAPYRLVSVRGDKHAGEPVVEMVFVCGGRTAKVIITNGNGNAAHEIGQARAGGAALASRAIGDWLVTAVGVDTPDGLLSLIEEARPELEEPQSVQASETEATGTSVPDATVAVPGTAPETGGITPDAAVAAPQEKAPETAVVVPETAIAAPQPVPNAASAASDPSVLPAVTPESKPSPPADPPEQTGTAT